jgi:mRNA interferase MazF
VIIFVTGTHISASEALKTEFWIAPAVKSHERPYQNDVGNQYSPTTIVAPLTKQYDPTDIYPFELEVLASNTTLTHDSVADLSQIRVVDISNRVTKNIGSVPATRMAKIDVAIKNSLGL